MEKTCATCRYDYMGAECSTLDPVCRLNSQWLAPRPTPYTAVAGVTRGSSSIPIEERDCGNCANMDNPLWRCEVCSPLNKNGLDYPTQWQPMTQLDTPTGSESEPITPNTIEDRKENNTATSNCVHCVSLASDGGCASLTPCVDGDNHSATGWKRGLGIAPGTTRNFDTGATRDTDEGKHDLEGFLSPLVLERFAEYMTIHRKQSDGQLRDSDNWQKGIPKDAYMKSGFRHFFDWWKEHRGHETEEGLEDALCALMFNVMGYLHETVKEDEDG